MSKAAWKPRRLQTYRVSAALRKEALHPFCLSLCERSPSSTRHPVRKQTLHCARISYSSPRLAFNMHPVFAHIPYYRRTSLTIEGNALRITTHNSWKSLTIEGRPLLINSWFKTIPYYRTKTFPYYIMKSLTKGNPFLLKEHLPLQLKEILYYRMKSLAIERKPLLYKEIPYYRRKCLTNNNK